MNIMKGNFDVFISYSSKELGEVNTIKSILEKNNIVCWMAPQDIPGGSNYAKEIPYAIRQCEVFLLVLSEHAQHSIWVSKELDTALNAKKVILPVMIEDCTLTDEFAFYLTGAQRYEAFKRKEEVLKSLVKRIKAIVDIDEEPGSMPSEKEINLNIKKEEGKSTNGSKGEPYKWFKRKTLQVNQKKNFANDSKEEPSEHIQSNEFVLPGRIFLKIGGILYIVASLILLIIIMPLFFKYGFGEDWVLQLIILLFIIFTSFVGIMGIRNCINVSRIILLICLSTIQFVPMLLMLYGEFEIFFMLVQVVSFISFILYIVGATKNLKAVSQK